MPRAPEVNPQVAAEADKRKKWIQDAERANNPWWKNAISDVTSGALGAVEGALGLSDEVGSGKGTPDAGGWGNVIGETAQDLTPLGAIGLVPPHYLKPMAKALKEKVLNRPDMPFKKEIEEIIDKYPRIAGNLSTIHQFDPTLPGNRETGGHYTNINVPYSRRETFRNEPSWRSMLDDHISGKTQPEIYSYMGDVGINPTLETNPEFNMYSSFTPKRVLRHEFGHAAQDISGDLQRDVVNNPDLPYRVRPREISARVNEQKARAPYENPKSARFNYDQALITDLNTHGIIARGSDTAPYTEAELRDAAEYLSQEMERKRGVRLAYDPKEGFRTEKVSPRAEFVPRLRAASKP
jgi:hypothetical protein